MTDLFTQDDQSTTAEILAYMPGENNRYKSVEALAKKGYEADRHIKTVEQENAELRATNLKLREDNETKAKLEQYIDQITKGNTAVTQPASESINQQRKDDQPFDPRQIESLVQSKIKEHEVSKTREQNVKVVTDALKERYGANYIDALNKQSEELGLTKQEINYLAETAPKALFRALKLDETPRQESFNTPPRSSPFFAPKAEQKHSWSYYQDIRKNNPELYRNPRTQAQMHQDYLKLGKDFEDGDFLSMGQESAF